MSETSNRVAQQNAIMVAVGTAGLYLWTEGGIYDMLAQPIANMLPALGAFTGPSPMATAAKWMSGGALFMVGSQFSAIQFI